MKKNVPEGLEKGQNGDWQKEGYTLHHKVIYPGAHLEGGVQTTSITAKDKNGQYAGSLSIETHPSGRNVIGWSEVKEPHQRKGLATSMYQLAEKHLGVSLKPSEFQSSDAEKLWAQSGRPFGKNEGNMSDDLKKGKNAKEEKKRIFGTDANAPRLSEKRMKMMQILRDYAKKKMNVDMVVASGKRDASGELREGKALEQRPFDVFTPKGHQAEKMRQDQIDAINRRKEKAGEKPIKRYDPKPDWQSGKLETQPSPDAAVHEIAHLIHEKPGQDLPEMQRRMDISWGESQKKYGHMQQKKTEGEIQPQAMENPIRRRTGLPANRSYKNPRPMEEHDRAVEQAIDNSGPRFVRGVKPGKNPQSVDYDRQSRLLSPENKEKFDQVDRGELVFVNEPGKGWVPGTSPNAKINIRAREAAKDPTRKDAKTLMRSEGTQPLKKGYEKNEQGELVFVKDKKPKNIPDVTIQYGKQGAEKVDVAQGTQPSQNWKQKWKAQSEQQKADFQKKLADQRASGMKQESPIQSPKGINGKTALSEIKDRQKMHKNDAPHMPETPEDKAHDVMEEGQSLQSVMGEVGKSGIGKLLQHLRSLKNDGLRSPQNQAAGADQHGVLNKASAKIPVKKSPAKMAEKTAHWHSGIDPKDFGEVSKSPSSSTWMVKAHSGPHAGKWFYFDEDAKTGKFGGNHADPDKEAKSHLDVFNKVVQPQLAAKGKHAEYDGITNPGSYIMNGKPNTRIAGNPYVKDEAPKGEVVPLKQSEKWPVPGMVPPSGDKSMLKSGAGQLFTKMTKCYDMKKSKTGTEAMQKKQGVPAGADVATHERCIQDVKAKGHSKSSAFAICNAAGAGMKKNEVK